jgi:hypothetical protein
VDDAGGVGVVDGVGERGDEGGRLLGPQRLVAELGSEGAAGDVFEDAERQPVALAAVVDLQDVGVSEAGDGLGLAAEAGEGGGVGVGAGEDDLEGNSAVEALLAGLVDDPIAPRPRTRPTAKPGTRTGGGAAVAVASCWPVTVSAEAGRPGPPQTGQRGTASTVVLPSDDALQRCACGQSQLSIDGPQSGPVSCEGVGTDVRLPPSVPAGLARR